MIRKFRTQRRIAGALLWLLLTAPGAVAAEAAGSSPAATSVTTQPAVRTQAYSAPHRTSPDEERPIVFAPAERQGGRIAGRREAVSPPSMFAPLFYVFLICAFFVGVLYLAKKHLPGHRRLFSHPAMEVLGRTHLDQRRYVSLLRVGKRILVVGVSPDELTSLSEITDESEITEIMEVARPKTESGLTVFQRLFQRTAVRQEAEIEAGQADDKARELEEQMSSLRRRVKTIRNREEPVGQIDMLG